MNPIELVRAYEAAWDSRDATAMPSFFHTDGIYLPAGERAVGGEDIAYHAVGVFIAFPDARMPITKIFADDNLVAVEWIFRGTMTGKYGRYKATGKSVELTGVHIIEVQRDRIKSVLSRWDRLDMLAQLGLV